jgi:hypothetical protein
MSYCKNCGHPSHCGIPLYSENHFSLKDEIQQGIKLCDSCSCEECCKHKCSKCKENKVCSQFDYRDYWGNLRGQMWICKDCLNDTGEC